jgi:hypothetical protein
MAGHSEIDTRNGDLGRWNRLRIRHANSCGSGDMVSRVRAATAGERPPSRRRVRVGCHGESPPIVYNRRKLVWQFPCTHTHSVSARPGRAPIMSDVMILQPVAERALRPASRPEAPPRWHKWQFGDAIRAFVHQCKRRGEARQPRPLLVVSNRCVVAHLCSPQERSDHPRSVAAPAVHRVIPAPDKVYMMELALIHVRRRDID